MDPIRNPYAPGAGTPPPELAGRDELRDAVRVALERVRLARPAKSVVLVGLRGVGKTVLLDRIREDAESTGVHALVVEAPEDRSLPAMLAPRLRQALLRLSGHERARDRAHRALRALAGFAKSLKVQYGASTPGTPPRRPPSTSATSNGHPRSRSPRWTKASSASGSTA